MSAIVSENLRKTFTQGEETIVALDDVDVSIDEGEFLCLSGPSGSGKTTLLNAMGGLISPDHGSILIGMMVAQSREKDAKQLAELRSRLHGLVLTEMGVDCRIELVPLHTLPRTSSGKLSRSKARLNYIDAQRLEQNGDKSAMADLLLKQAG